MKKAFTYLVIFFMAALVFYGGAGINLISYCCNICQLEGIEAVVKDKCCDIHHHDHSEHSSTDCCSLEWVSFDWLTQNSTELEKDLSPVTLDLLFSDIFAIIHSDNLTSRERFVPASHGPPKVLPRDYLSILTVLLI